MINNNWIVAPHTEEDFKTADLFPKESEKQELPAWRVLSRGLNAIMDYGKSLTVDVPLLNKKIATVSDMARAKLAEHNLGDATFEQLEQWMDETKQIVENINTHDLMTARFAVDHLFLGANSPVIGGYADLRGELREHIKDIFDQMMLAPRIEVKKPVQKAPEKLVAKEVEQQLKAPKAEEHAAPRVEERPKFGPEGIEEADAKLVDAVLKVMQEKNMVDAFGDDFDREKMIAQCNLCKLRPNLEDPHFDQYLQIHYKLYFSSPTYYDMINDITKNGVASCSTVARDSLITISSQRNFEFAGCWNAVKHSVMVTQGHPELDEDTIKELIPFEMTNAFQQAKFEEVDHRASKRVFEEPIGLDADQYAKAMENIEDDGLEIFFKIAHEVGEDLVPLQRWGKNWRGRRRLGNIMNSHGDYYRRHYVEQIRPLLDKVPDAQLTPQQKRYRDFQRNHWIPLLEPKENK